MDRPPVVPSALRAVWVTQCVRRLRGRSRGQGGFALALVLAVVGLTFLVIVALLGFLITTIRVTEDQERAARELRAADGAVTATVAHLRQNQTSATDACSPAVPSGGFQVPFDRVGGAGDVTVTCLSSGDFGPSAGEVKLVGDGYDGRITDWPTAWPWSSIGSPQSGVDPSLIHTGDEALRFNGNVVARRGTAALRDPTSGTPAVNVRGGYTQGTPGLGGTGSSCGLLEQADSPTQVVASSGLTCGASVGAPAAQDYGIDMTERNVSGGCPSGPVVTFAAGRYGQEDVRTLNRWFDGSCPNRTFYFPTGIYWFDANDPSVSAVRRHLLVFDDPTSSFVFGQANGWSTTTGATAADFPNACRAGVAASSPGASLVLSGRTELRHVAGRLAVCPFVSSDGTAYPTVLQQSTAPRGVQVVSATSTAWANADNMRSGSSATPAGPAVFTCNLPPGGLTVVTCESQRSFTLGLRSEAAGPIRSASLRVTGDETNATVSAVQSRTARVRVTLAGGGTCDAAPTAGAPDNGRTSMYELVSGSCASALTDANQLDGASLEVTYAYRYAGVCTSSSPCPIAPANAQQLALWNTGVEVDAWTGDAGAATDVAPLAWSPNGVQNVRVDDTLASPSATLCGQPVCGLRSELTYERSLRLSNIDSRAGADLGDDDELESLGIAVDQTGAQAQGFNLATLPGRTQLRLTLHDGTVCNRTFDGIANAQGRTYYSMIDPGGSDCGGVVLTPGQMTGANLIGSSIELRYVLDCIAVNGTCTYFQPVGLQYAGLVATSSTYDGPVTQAEVHVDANASGAGSSANFFGPAYLPHSSLDIYWNGEPSGASIFGGELQLHSLGSVMASGAAADVVCCTRPEVDERIVVLTAWIGTEKRLAVTVRIPGDPSRAATVLDWTECGRSGECS